MPCTCAPALNKLKTQLDAAYPDRDKSSDGCCADANHPPSSDHSPTNGYAHARDIDENLEPNTGDKPLLPWISDLLKDPRSKYVIYEGRIYYASCNSHGSLCFSQGGHTYTGANAHDKHLHLSIKLTATHDTRPWVLPQEEDMFSDTDRQTLLNVQNWCAKWDANLHDKLIAAADKIIAAASGGGLTNADRTLITSLRDALVNSPLNPGQ